MLKHKIRQLLIIASIIAVVILISIMVTGFDKMTVQAQSEDTNADLSYFLEHTEKKLETKAKFDVLALANNVEMGKDVSSHSSLVTGTTIRKEQYVDTNLGQDSDINHLTFQSIYTNEIKFLLETVDGVQIEVADDTIERGDIDAQSTNSGSEYISSAAIRHDGISPGSGYRFWPTGGYIRNNSPSEMCLSGPVYLPNGATITEFSMYFVDDHPVSDMAAVFLRKNHSHPSDLVELITSMDFDSLDLDEPTIFRGFNNNLVLGTEAVSNNFGYYFAFCFDANTGLEQLVYGFRIDYTIP